MSSLELKVPPLAQVGVFAGLMWLAARALPAPAFTFPGQLVAALLLVAAGALVAGAGVVAFRRARTTVDPRDPGKSTELVATGIYRASRNPMYLGFLLALAGWGIFLGNALALAALPVFVAAINRLQIAPEERVLRARFGESYTRYERSVRRWL
ncbi:MAG TPA: isoprenylcysteine carboxylmethyltransferase family protein [Ramlibacter sp.]